MNVVKEIEKINEQEMKVGIFGGISKGSWHEKYKDSAWVFIGGFSYELSEGDLICVMSQWGEIEDINLVRNKETNKSMGFAFLKYENQKSTVLAVDNFNGVKLLGRVLRCDHVDKYKLPKEIRDKEEELLDENPEASVEIGPGHSYKDKELASEHNIHKGVNLFEKQRSGPPQSSKGDEKEKKEKGEKRSRKDKDKDSDIKKSKKEHKDKKSKKDKDKHRHDKNDPNAQLKELSEAEKKFIRYRKEGRDKEMPLEYLPSGSQDTDFSRPGVGGVGLASFRRPEEGAPVASWRGSRDPSAAPVSSGWGKGKNSSSSSCEQKTEYTKRDEFSGMGGMNRIR